MLIENVGGELELTLSTEDSQGDAEQGLQLQRRNHPSGQGNNEPRNRDMKEVKLKRKKKNGGASSGRHDSSHLVAGTHQTIILLDRNNVTDTVVFECAQPFVVDVEFDPSARDVENPQPRRSPFVGWDTPQFSAPDPRGVHVVTGVFNNDKRKERLPNGSDGQDIDDTRPTDQRFYKATVWSEGLKLDPDWYCDR
jgi:hypothetical protein